MEATSPAPKNLPKANEPRIDRRNRAGYGFAPLPDANPPKTPRVPVKADDWFDGGDGESRPLPFAYVDGSGAAAYTILEVMGGGAALLDYDRDGLMDIYVTGGGSFGKSPVRASGRAGALFHNLGGGSFADVTRNAGLQDDQLYTHGATVGDYNRDGYPDLFVAGYQGCRLYRNEKDGSFSNQTATAGLSCPNWNMTGCWADIDNDGWLDLYVVTYAKFKLDPEHICINDWNLRDVCPPTEFEGEVDQLWRNRGDGTFEDVSHQAGVDVPGRGMGIVAADLDEDGWIDFYVTNDMEENVLLYGGPNLTFSSEAIPAGTAFSPTGEREGSMGVDLGDYNGDGKPDFIYTNYVNQDISLLEMVDKRGFVNATSAAGLSGSTSSWVGFGTAFADFDSDGWQDLFVINGHVMYERSGSHYSQPPRLFRNLDGRRFMDASPQGGPYFRAMHAGRGAAVGDLNNDGGLDLVVVHQQERVAVLFNQHPPKHWIGLRLQGQSSNPDAIGARINHQFAGRELTRWVHGGGSYLSSCDQRIVLPADDASPVSVKVRWPDGRTADFSDLIPNRFHELVEARRPTE
ncbi:MAG: hypothetical protein JWP89_1150 [Schlesneria sp.]|nr:hypothetical protein [Schlesneria sp.]